MAATSVWASAADGFWDTAANWAQGILPAKGDDVRIEAPITVTYRTGELELKSLYAPQTHLVLQSDDLADGLMVRGPTTLQALTINATGFRGWGETTVDELTMREGAIVGYLQGLFTVSGKATFDGAGSTLFMMDKAMRLNGASVWTAGNGSIDMLFGKTRGAQLEIGTAGTFLDQGALDSTGVKKLQTDQGSTFLNAGTFVRTGIGTTQITGNLSNTGTMRVEQGILALEMTNSQHSGLLDIREGAQLSQQGFSSSANFSAGSRLRNEGLLDIGDRTAINFTSTAQYMGNGTVNIHDGGQLTHASGIEIAKLSLNNGTLRAGTSATIGELILLHGSNIEGTATVTGPARLGWGFVKGTLNLNGHASWDEAGSIGGRGTLRVAHGADLQDHGTNGQGSVEFLGKFINEGTYTRQSGQGTRLFQGDGVHNLGTFDLRSGTTRINGLDNTGLVSVTAGNLILEGSNTNAGQIKVEAGAQLSIEFGALTLSDGQGLHGGGSLQVGQAGHLTVEQGTLKADLGRNLGTISLGDDAKLEAVNRHIVNAGRLSGNGSFIGNVTSEGGRFTPGDATMAIGRITVVGDVVLNDGSVLDMDLGFDGSSDLLQVEGSIKLDGLLRVTVTDDDLVADGQEWVLARYGIRLEDSGFDSFTVTSSLPYEWQLIYSDNDVRLRALAVPEPGTWHFMILGLLGIVAAGRRRTRH